MTKARGHQNPPLNPRSRTAGFWGAIMGSKNLTTPAHFILGPRPTPRRKKCPKTNEENPNCQAASPRTGLSSANRDYRGEERHAIKGRLVLHPKKKDKYCGSAMGAWWGSNSRRNCYLHIKCPQLTFWSHWWGNDPWIVLLWLLQLTESLRRRLMGQALEKWSVWSTNGGLRLPKRGYI